MKVQVHWEGKVDNARYVVPGKNVRSAVKFMNSRGEWGKFKSSLTQRYWRNNQNLVYKVRLTPSYKITMPTWPAYRNQTQKIKDSWDAMYVALKKHENQHKEIFTSGLNQLENDLTDSPNISLAAFLTIFNTSIKATKKRHSDFDTETENGAARGVEIIE